ncbi:glycosyl transferase family 1 [Stella humosa]|uniref:Glycosyl transferase family 1 n=1 Tax=Stella humosa TaxID=94 RepID=A0A3N1LK70_9PROT|nr:rhamnan synthesis F family protein [Stella humosa]ROP91268.1 glycosyl transferase family 1 [Stella humosa]
MRQEPEAGRPPFDEDHYRRQLPPGEAGGDAWAHYCATGWRRGLDPHPLFSSRHYLARAPGAAESGLDPLTHYLRVGAAAGRSFHPAFDIVRYRDLLPPGETAADPLLHYLIHGAGRGLSPCDFFDPEYYLQGAGPEAASDPLSHYLSVGWRRGLAFHPLFAPDWYMAQPGAGRHSPIPLVDFLLTPVGAKRIPHPFVEPGQARPDMLDRLLDGGAERSAPAINRLRSDGWFRRDGGSRRGYLAARPRHRAAGRRRVVFVGHEASRSGAPLILLRLIEHAVATGLLEPFVILVKGGALLDAYAATAHVLLAEPGEAPGEMVRYLLDRLADEPPAAGLVNTIARPDFLPVLARAGLPPHVMVYEPPDMAPANDVRVVALHAHRLVFASHDTAARFARLAPNAKGTSVALHAGSTAPTLRGLSRPDEPAELIVLGCGVLSWRKGIDWFVAVARKVLALLPVDTPVRFRWVGPSQQRHHEGVDLWAVYDAEAFGVGHRVEFAGPVEDMAGHYAEAAIFLCTSRADAFPGVVLEAMDAGLPVIAFDGSGGAPEALAEGAGIIVPYGDIDAMAAAAAALLRSSTARREMGARAADRIARSYRFADYTAAVLRPILPAIRAEQMAGVAIAGMNAGMNDTGATPATAPVPAVAAKPAPRLDPLRATVLVVVDGRDSESAILALNLAGVLRQSRNVVLAICAARALAVTGRLAAHVVALLDLAQMRNPGGLKIEFDRLADEHRVVRAILVGTLPPAIAITLAARFVPAVHVPARALGNGPDREMALWSQAVVATTPAIADSVAAMFPERTARDRPCWPVGRSRIWTGSVAGRRAAVERLQAALGGGGGEGRPLTVLGAGPPTLEGGFDRFMDCAARLAEHANIRFLWICDPGSTDSAEWQATRRRLAEDARYRRLVPWGETPSLDPVYPLAGIFLATGGGDRIPTAVAGAMEHRLPVVAFRDGGALAALLAGNGWLVDEFDAAAAAAVIARLAGAVAERTAAGQAAELLARTFLPMVEWVAQVDRLAIERATDAAREQADVATILADPEFDHGEFAGPDRDAGERAFSVLTHVRHWSAGFCPRRPAPGVHPGVLRENGGHGSGDPFAGHIRAGKPAGPGRREVIGPDAQPGVETGMRAALHIHLFHTDLGPDLLRRLAVNRHRCDLILTTDTPAKAREIAWSLGAMENGRARVVVVPNRGRDLGAFLTGVGGGMLAGYDVVGHLHGKKARHQSDSQTERWRERLFQSLLGEVHPMMDAILARFAADPRLGLVHPDDPHLIGWDERPPNAPTSPLRSNRHWAGMLAPRLGLDRLPAFFDFPVGSMFWARRAALQPLFDLDLGWQDYPDEPVDRDGTVLHAIERLFGIVAERAGYRVAVSHVPGFTR